MATFQTQQALGRGPVGGVGGASQEITRYASFSATAAATNDVFQMIRVPVGAIITACALKCTDLDSNGTPTIALGVGDGGSTQRLIASSTIAQAGGSTDTLANGGRFFQYTVEDTIDVTVLTGSATFQAGTIELMVKYIVNPMAS